MIKKSMWKSIFRDIRSSLNRFVAIFAITALGAGFYTGLKSTSPDMLATADLYYQDLRLMDYRLLSTMGFTQQDVDALATLPEVGSVMATYGMDALVQAPGGTLAVRLNALPQNPTDQNDSYLNRLVLTEGRLPQNPGECVADSFSSGRIGDVITLSDENPAATLDQLARREFRVVGRARSPVYISMTRGNTAIGNGSISAFYYLHPGAVQSDYYTDVYLRAAGTDDISAFSAAYEQMIDQGQGALEAFGEQRAEVRYNEIYSEASAALADARAELDAGERTLESQKVEALRELDQARRELDDGERALSEGLRQIRENEQTLAQGQTAYDQGLAEMATGQARLESGQADYDAGQGAYEAALALYEGAGASLDEMQAAYDRASQDIEGLEAQAAALDEALGALDAALAALEAADTDEQRQAAEAGVQAAGRAVLDLVRGASERLSQNGLGEAAQALDRAAADMEAAAGEMDRQALDQALAALAESAGGEWPGWDGSPAGAAGLLRILADDTALALEQAGLAEAAEALRTAAAQAEAALEGGDTAGVAAILRGAIAQIRPWLQDPRAALAQAGEALAQARAQWAAMGGQLQEAAALLAQSAAVLEAGRAELEAGRARLTQAAAQLLWGRAQLDEAKGDAQKARRQLDQGKAAYEEADKQAGAALDEARSQLDAGKAELDKQQRALDDLMPPTWYVLDRTANPGYSGFGSDADRIDSIAAVFPVFFFLVAALVCLTTMTRMVEEQRTQIGTFKALGFQKGAIAFKYILYAGAASVMGAVCGVMLCSVLFPTVIWNAYQILYLMPDLHLSPQMQFILTSVGAAVLCTTLATLAACYNELRSVPAALMRPKAPRAGKRILLERVTPLWRRLGFSQKVTMRNLFRYKNRFVMTVAGVAGCTALLLTGFGLRDSITGIVDLQYGEIDQYDMVAALDGSSDSGADSPLNELLKGVGAGLYLEQSHLDAANGKATSAGMTTYLYAVETPEQLHDFVDLHNRQSGQAIPFPQGDGVVVTEKLASRLGVGVGDPFSISRVDEPPKQVRVAGVMENYVLNYVYMTGETYRATFGEAPAYNTVYIRLDPAQKDRHEEILKQLVDTEGVAGATDIASFRGQIGDMLQSLDAVVWVIILSAGTLAFVVLYNLTNINITERQREIATLKVLGFYEGEVAAYVYRENLILTLIGTVLGLGTGVFLHRFVIRAAEVDEVMFRRAVMPLSYLWAVLFTLACALLVNLVMLRRLRNIDMVESLKSAE